MRALIRAAFFFARDRAGRAALLVALGLAVLLPSALRLEGAGGAAEGFRDGLAAGPAGASVLAGLWGIFLLAGVLLLWQGIVSGTVAAGRHRTLLARPLWRPGFYLARHAAALFLLVLAAMAAGLVLLVAGGSGASRPLALLVATLLTGWSLGGLLLLLSSVLDRGDVLAAVALFLAPAAADGLVAVGAPSSGAAGALGAVLPPVLALRDARHALLAGGPLDGGEVAAIVAYGAAALVLAILRLQTREFRPG